MNGIPRRLRDLAMTESPDAYVSLTLIKRLLIDAADLIERQATTIASWEAAAAIQRGSIGGHAQTLDDDVAAIVAAETNTPR